MKHRRLCLQRKRPVHVNEKWQQKILLKKSNNCCTLHLVVSVHLTGFLLHISPAKFVGDWKESLTTLVRHCHCWSSPHWWQHRWCWYHWRRECVLWLAGLSWSGCPGEVTRCQSSAGFALFCVPVPCGWWEPIQDKLWKKTNSKVSLWRLKEFSSICCVVSFLIPLLLICFALQKASQCKRFVKRKEFTGKYFRCTSSDGTERWRLAFLEARAEPCIGNWEYSTPSWTAGILFLHVFYKHNVSFNLRSQTR